MSQSFFKQEVTQVDTQPLIWHGVVKWFDSAGRISQELTSLKIYGQHIAFTVKAGMEKTQNGSLSLLIVKKIFWLWKQSNLGNLCFL